MNMFSCLITGVQQYPLKQLMISSSEPQVQVRFSVRSFVCLSVNISILFTSFHELLSQITQHLIKSFLMERVFSMTR